MIHVTPEELSDLRQCLSSLETILNTLDRIGAGIAAIHVDAAINQLEQNIEVIADRHSNSLHSLHPCPSEHPVGLP